MRPGLSRLPAAFWAVLAARNTSRPTTRTQATEFPKICGPGCDFPLTFHVCFRSALAALRSRLGPPHLLQNARRSEHDRTTYPPIQGAKQRGYTGSRLTRSCQMARVDDMCQTRIHTHAYTPRLQDGVNRYRTQFTAPRVNSRIKAIFGRKTSSKAGVVRLALTEKGKEKVCCRKTNDCCKIVNSNSNWYISPSTERSRIRIQSSRTGLT